MNGNDASKLNGQKSFVGMLDAINELKEAGFNQKQAETLLRIQEYSNSQLATKEDITLIRKDIKTDMKELELRITRFYFITTLTAIGVILGGMMFLGKFGLLAPMKTITKTGMV